MDELKKLDKDFEIFYKTQKNLWKRELDQNMSLTLYHKEKELFREKIISLYVNELEKTGKVVNLCCSQVSECCRLSKFIIKKTYVLENCRINWEINALKKLARYPYFPKILFIDMDKRLFYMTDVGESLKSIHSIKALPSDLMEQVTNMIKSLKEAEIFHRDLSLEHFCLRDGRLSLIDFEKCFLSNDDYESNKKRNTSSWCKLKYHDMNHIQTMINDFYNNLLKKELQRDKDRDRDKEIQKYKKETRIRSF
jgi:hypothetical protein